MDWVASRVLASSSKASRSRTLLYSWLKRCAALRASEKYVLTSQRVRSGASGQK